MALPQEAVMGSSLLELRIDLLDDVFAKTIYIIIY